ncbi:DNA-protecting protein DprA [Nocardioides mangrovicus]|uniref:DNA-protecting protein DprA n=1 Tax=Nocardioides mangrovicus TaxID=2478913 RepID=A0A3L8P2Q1_9ACTN|nr:DNA-processing protein DprA [Nocardioides mangrovicus]RLV48839.1 DNA-protecting protein DprA [Nocardioides mangrovicus]
MSAGSAPSRAERLARVALCRLTEPANPELARRVAAGGAEALYEELRSPRGSSAPEAAADVAARLADLDPAGDLRRAEQVGARFVIPGDDEWPEQLDPLTAAEPVGHQGGAPIGLWVRGRLHLAETMARAVAVVGARSATTYGGDVAVEIAAGVSEAGYTVVSGGAFGIDLAAHRGALASHRPTVAVMACGPDRVYPLDHRELIDHIARTGLVVSDLAPGCTPTKWRFLARNRIIAGLSLGTVVVEAATRSGAANTASWTESLHRPVMGVPGPITSAQSEGVHRLIRTRGALLVTRAAEVLEVVAPMGEHLMPDVVGEVRPTDGLRLLDQQVLDAVPISVAADLDQITRHAGLAASSVELALGRLADLGHVRLDQGRWRKAPRCRSA